MSGVDPPSGLREGQGEGAGAARALAREWLSAARDPGVAAELEVVYDQVAREIRERGPACWASGRCCNFEKARHRLYCTGLEAAYCAARLHEAGQELSAASLADALERGGCPFQAGNLCGVHLIKPLGCRVFFCDRSAQAWQEDLTERMLAAVRAIHDRHGIEYRYGEWRGMLAALLEAGETTS